MDCEPRMENDKERSMLTIKILGSGCPNCKKVEETVSHAAAGMGVEAEFLKVTDYGKITEYPLLSTPGLVIH